jgi:hypothetical protein
LMGRRMFAAWPGAGALFYATMILPLGWRRRRTTTCYDADGHCGVLALWESEQAQGRRRWG